MTGFVTHWAELSIQYNTLTDVIFQVGLSSLIPFSCSITINANVRRGFSQTFAKITNVIQHLKLSPFFNRYKVNIIAEEKKIIKTSKFLKILRIIVV